MSISSKKLPTDNFTFGIQKKKLIIFITYFSEISFVSRLHLGHIRLCRYMRASLDTFTHSRNGVPANQVFVTSTSFPRIQGPNPMVCGVCQFLEQKQKLSLLMCNCSLDFMDIESGRDERNWQTGGSQLSEALGEMVPLYVSVCLCQGG